MEQTILTHRDDSHARVDSSRDILFRVVNLSSDIVGLIPPVKGPQSRVECEGIL
jgi:hypothetical protein